MLNERIIRDYSTSVYMNDLNRTINSQALFNQKDVKTAVLVVQLLNNKSEKAPIDLTGSNVMAKILKNDNTKSVLYCSVLSPELGTVAVAFTEQTLLTIGVNTFELEIQSENQVVYSPKIAYTVTDNLFDENELIMSQDEFPILNSLIHNVQLIEQELLNLDSIVNQSEQIREENENKRKNDDVLRGTEFENIKLTIQEKVNLINEKMEEVNNLICTSEEKIDNEIIRINGDVNLKISEMNNKITEVNNKLVQVDNSIARINTTISDNIKKVNDKITEVNNLISSIQSTFSEKITEINNKIKEFEANVDNSISKVELESSKINNSLSTSVNNSISKMENEAARVNNNLSSLVNLKIGEMNTEFELMETEVNRNINLISDKISNYDEKISLVEELNTKVTSEETIRNNNEIKRNETIRNIVEELEITQSDINDILNMIGGL